MSTPKNDNQLGDEHGVVEHGRDAQHGPWASRRDIVSQRWVATCLHNSAREVDEVSVKRPIWKDIDYVAGHLRWAAAAAEAYPLLARAGNGRVAAGDLADVADLFCAGRGTVAQLVAELVDGAYADAPRGEEDGELLL